MVRTYDDDLADLAAQLPGFGGLYLDSTGELVVQLKDVSRLQEAKAKVQQFLLTRSGGNSVLAHEYARYVDGMKAVRARYDFRELHSWYRILRKRVFGLGTVTMSDINERRNRIMIGVTDTASIQLVDELLVRLPVPREAIIVQVFPRFKGQASLQGTVRPVIGGVQIGWIPGRVCTLSYNVASVLTGGSVDYNWYFVTASHCTDKIWALTGHSMGQPTEASPIGVEVSDPPLFDSQQDPICPPGKLCRYSDAALFRYGATTWTHGVVAWPADSQPFFETTRIISVHGTLPPFEGMLVEKVGRTTGRTAGTLLFSCIDVEREYGPHTFARLICQGLANYDADPGDSGAPVVRVLSDGTLVALGIHGGEDVANPGWGYKVFSPTGQWRSELGNDIGGTLQVTADWAPPPVVSISGHTYLPPGLSCTWTASASGGVPPYASYQWSGVLSGSGNQITGVVWESGWLYVQVTDSAGHVGENSIFITIDPNAPAPPDCQE
ncbi:MAG: hypothetical protein KatS3mg081_2707 [Gemmatimonadales bacterium]|nr:MAG: hypothetical protein KatS3mg081_2707 [Gemmatimonadales bacterium]